MILFFAALGLIAVLTLLVWDAMKLPADFERVLDLEGTPISSGPSSGGAHAALPSEAKACAHPQDLPRLG